MISILVVVCVGRADKGKKSKHKNYSRKESEFFSDQLCSSNAGEDKEDENTNVY